MHNGCWNGYHIQNALVIVHNGRPKILCAWFLKDKENYWHYGKNCWDERQTEAHITVCSKVPDHIKRLWTPGARADDPWQQWGQGVEGSSTEGAPAASSRELPA